MEPGIIELVIQTLQSFFFRLKKDIEELGESIDRMVDESQRPPERVEDLPV